ncbi:hypothetical protein BDY24DRAFT_184861 [Mrakia frigida]|uniref:uncharacterized protein n=1 Tax=Mrakia frigida TaxID=29902 RepID=UPI003FCC2692
MGNLPHFRRGGHYGGEDGVDAAPWGVRWEEDRREVRGWLRSQRAEALFQERSHLFTYKQCSKMLDTLEESLLEDKLDPSRRPTLNIPEPSFLAPSNQGRPLPPDIRIQRDNGPPAAHARAESEIGGGSNAGTVGSRATSHAAETAHDSDQGLEDETEHRQFVCGIIAVIAKHRMEVFSAEHRRKLFGRSIFHGRIGNLLNIPLLGIPLIYLSRVERIYGDEVGFRNASWREFIEGLVMEWTSLNLISSLLLSSAMTMTGADEVSDFPYTRMAGFATSILSIGSLVHSIFLTWTHQAKGQSDIDVGHPYLDRHAHSFTRLAVMLSLPAVMLLWALIFFAVAICAWAWEERLKGADPGGWLVSSSTTTIMAITLVTVFSSIGSVSVYITLDLSSSSHADFSSSPFPPHVPDSSDPSSKPRL